MAVPFSAREREGICRAAAQHKITPETFIQKVAYYAARDDMYKAVVDEAGLIDGRNMDPSGC